MIRTIKFTLLLTLLFSLGTQLYASEVMMTGAKKGKWTMDYDAALKLAKKNNMPVFLKFTGSDWCKWCILMEGSVFTKQKWSDFANENIVLVTLDFPRKTALAPDMAERNNRLAKEMGVRGYPTYIVLDSDGSTRLGQLGAGEDKTVDSFIEEVQNVIKYSHAGIEKFANSLDAENREKYIQSFKELKVQETEMNGWAQTVTSWTPENVAKYQDYERKLSTLNNTIRDIEIDKYASKLSSQKSQEYRILNSRLKAAQAEFNAWLDSRPERTPENTELYQGYQTKLQDLSMEISRYEM